MYRCNNDWIQPLGGVSHKDIECFNLLSLISFIKEQLLYLSVKHQCFSALTSFLATVKQQPKEALWVLLVHLKKWNWDEPSWLKSSRRAAKINRGEVNAVVFPFLPLYPEPTLNRSEVTVTQCVCGSVAVICLACPAACCLYFLYFEQLLTSLLSVVIGAVLWIYCVLHNHWSLSVANCNSSFRCVCLCVIGYISVAVSPPVQDVTVTLWRHTPPSPWAIYLY